ncbi:MAG: 50S ribosomal protein L11 methyltransferase [Kiloniellales bacterium]
MRSKNGGWRIDLVVPAAAVPLFEAALERFGDAVSGFETAPGGGWRLQAYAAAEPDRAALEVALALAAAGAGVPEPVPTIAALPAIDWLEENRKDFPPIRAGRYLIHGSHDPSAAPPGGIGLCLDAATAFGTGRHESTRGCLLALDRLARRRRVRRALDIGCGTGILAIAAARTWRAAVVAADVDPEAVRVARHNVRVNGVASLVRVVPSDGMRSAAVARGAPYDLITANLFARLLRLMAPELTARLAVSGGTAVLSGLMQGDETAVVAAHRAQGLRPVDRVVIGDWSTVVMTRLGGGEGARSGRLGVRRLRERTVGRVGRPRRRHIGDGRLLPPGPGGGRRR